MRAPIHMSATEVAAYYRERVPRLKLTQASEWRGPCPIHDGEDDNFSVQAETGRWYCHSQCARGGDIFDLESALTGADFVECKAVVFAIVNRVDVETIPLQREAAKPLSPPPSGGGRAQEVARYPYLDTCGNVLYEVIRFVKPNGSKTFLQVRPSGVAAAGTVDVRSGLPVPTGGDVWGLDGGSYVLAPQSELSPGKPSWKRASERAHHSGPRYQFDRCPRVPYRLPEVLTAKTIYLVEGEKDVHTLQSWNLIASCNPGGVGNTSLYKSWPEYFRDRDIIILPDNDEPGRKHALLIAETLVSVAKSVRILELPGIPEKGDVTDWVQLGGTREQLDTLVAGTSLIDSVKIAELRAGQNPNSAAEIESEYVWPRISSIQDELPPVMGFSPELLPPSFRDLVLDVADRMQVPIDYPATVTMLCLSGAVNRRAIIQPKASDSGWAVVPNLWGGIVAPPGYMKSPVIAAITKPLNDIQSEWRSEHAEAMKSYAQDKLEGELRYAAWKEQYKAALKRGAVPPSPPEQEIDEPKLKRLIVNDATFEALHQTMRDNPAGVLVSRDELTGWWSQLDRTGREGERAFCLQAWNGDTGHTIDRIERGTIHVDACCMSMLGGIQPGRLRSYLAEALEDGPSNDGLVQRFQLLVWPDTSPRWTYVDRKPNADAEARAAHTLRALVAMNEEQPERLRFAPDAQELFVDWLCELEGKIRADELHPALVSHLSKYRKLMPALAGLLQLADTSPVHGDLSLISLENTRRAAAWCEYLESHAKRVYSCVVTPQLRAARDLAEKVKRRVVGTDRIFTSRDVYLKGWAGLDSPDAVKHAAEVLQDAGWVREVTSKPGRAGGRPCVRYEVNPRVWNE